MIFATGNENKLKEAGDILKIDIKGTELEIPEIQSLDTEQVALAKARAYFAQLKEPLFVEDISMVIHAWNGLPGTYINDFMRSLGNEGILRLMKNEEDRSAYVQATIVYIDNQSIEHTFSGRVDGSITEEERGDNGWGFDPIFTPNGQDLTFGEMDPEQKNEYSMRAKALLELKLFLDE